MLLLSAAVLPGLEAACTAAEVGCTTFLIEKEDHVGGLSVAISKIPDKRRLRDFPGNLIHRAQSLRNLITFTETTATPAFVKMLKPDFIINATGSTPLLPPISGLRENIDAEGSRVSGILGMIQNIEHYSKRAGRQKGLRCRRRCGRIRCSGIFRKTRRSSQHR